MLLPEVSVLEKVVRAAAVYAFLLGILRLFGRRQFSQMTAFDLVVLLILSNVVQNAMIGKDDSLLGGFIGAATILALNWAVARVVARSRRVERLIEGNPILLVHRGRILEKNMARENVSHEELASALRAHGFGGPARVHAAILEPQGGLSVISEAGAGKKPSNKIRRR